MAESVVKRPFWLHQFAEYILGLALVAVGVQSPTPVMPCVSAAVIIIHAAITTGPLAAFSVVNRKVHRVIDVGVIAFEIVAAVQPFVSVEATTRLIMLAIAFVHAFIWWQTSFATKPPKPPKRAAAAPAAPSSAPGSSPAPTAPAPAPAPAPVAEPASGRGADIGRTAGRFVGNAVRVAREVKAKRDPPTPS